MKSLALFLTIAAVLAISGEVAIGGATVMALHSHLVMAFGTFFVGLGGGCFAFLSVLAALVLLATSPSAGSETNVHLKVIPHAQQRYDTVGGQSTERIKFLVGMIKHIGPTTPYLTGMKGKPR